MLVAELELPHGGSLGGPHRRAVLRAPLLFALLIGS
jgi:hypothetical protein